MTIHARASAVISSSETGSRSLSPKSGRTPDTPTAPPTSATKMSQSPRRAKGAQRRRTGAASSPSRLIKARVLAVGTGVVVSATEEGPQCLIRSVRADLQRAGRDPDAGRRCRDGYPLELQHLEGFTLRRRQPIERLLEARVPGIGVRPRLRQRLDEDLARRARRATPEVVERDVSRDRESHGSNGREGSYVCRARCRAISVSWWTSSSSCGSAIQRRRKRNSGEATSVNRAPYASRSPRCAHSIHRVRCTLRARRFSSSIRDARSEVTRGSSGP